MALLDEVLFWLNDRCGQKITVSVDVDLGDHSTTVVTAEGELKHWTKMPLPTSGEWSAIGAEAGLVAGPGPRDDIRGLYTVGTGSLDVSGLDERFAAGPVLNATQQAEIAKVTTGGPVDPGLRIQLAENVDLIISVDAAATGAA
ncbi:MAG: hypothetical protein ACR2IP_05875 [Solirubrobacteraceae bacterium]